MNLAKFIKYGGKYPKNPLHAIISRSIGNTFVYLTFCIFFVGKYEFYE